jgi:hypothetical protein
LVHLTQINPKAQRLVQKNASSILSGSYLDRNLSPRVILMNNAVRFFVELIRAICLVGARL